MSHSGGIVQAPVDFETDLGVVHGTSSGDLGTNVEDGSVNKWAKYKYIRSSKKRISDADRQDAYFGLKVTPCGPNGNLSTFLSGFTSEWEYLRPRGYAYNEFERALDTVPDNLSGDGYNSNANCFINVNDLTLPSNYYTGGGGAGITFHVGINAGASLRPGSISINDIKLGGSEGTSFANCYFGLIFVNGDFKKIITGNTPAQAVGSGGTGGVEITIAESSGALTGLTNGVTYSVYPVLSKFEHSSLSNFANTDIIVALPLSPFTFKSQPMSTQQNISFKAASASLDPRGRLTFNFTLGMAATGAAPSSMTATYVVYTASGPDDTTGTQIASGTVYGLTTTTDQSVSRTVQSTNPGWIRIHAENQNNSQVYADTWVEVNDNPLPDE